MQSNTYTAFGALYENKPKFIVHGRLKNCTSVRDLVSLASSKGFDVSFEPSGFVNDIRLSEGYDASAPLRHHTIRSARRFLEQHPGAV
jgi:hypothetical protein